MFRLDGQQLQFLGPWRNCIGMRRHFAGRQQGVQSASSGQDLSPCGAGCRHVAACRVRFAAMAALRCIFRLMVEAFHARGWRRTGLIQMPGGVAGGRAGLRVKSQPTTRDVSHLTLRYFQILGMCAQATLD
jgi:hypothetical protein